MEPIQILLREHRAIAVALTRLEVLVRALRSGAPLEEAQLAAIVSFARDFVDQVHHRKEEPHLFDAAAGLGLPPRGFPIGVLHAEHHQGRTYLARMEHALPLAASGHQRARRDLARALQGYVHLLREHIPKEERTLFAIAAASLSEAETQRLRAAFAAISSANAVSQQRRWQSL